MGAAQFAQRPSGTLLPDSADDLANSPRMARQWQQHQAIVNSPRQLRQRQEALAYPPRANNTGLPDQLKSGIEALSGVSLDDVQVHYNSSEPAQLQALAYAQGTAIHLGPGQEQHLPHEAWHVVQQKQGRVKPTRQLKGGAINDDRGLEREADVMGARAAQHSGGPAENAGPRTPGAAASAAPVSQRRVDPNLAPVVERPVAAQYLFRNCYQRPGDVGLMVDINWHGPAQEIIDIIQKARPALENDDDVADLQGIEHRADALVTPTNALVRDFDQTPAFTVERMRLADQLNAARLSLHALLRELESKFSLSEGGFSAKGRATEIGGVRLETRAGTGDSSFVGNTLLNGAAIATAGVRKPATVAEAGPQRLQVNGRTYDSRGTALNGEGKATELASLNSLAAPAGDRANVTGFAARSREEGQEAAMNGTNARGYAWLTGTPGWNTTRWEWLHIRGAALNGATRPTNLVLGTRDSNTHMMPFESNLKSLAKIVAEHDQVHDSMTVTWSISGALNQHRYNQIRIQWLLNNSATAPDDQEEHSGDVRFSPLATGSVLSKAEVGLLEDALREARDNVARNPDVDMGSEDD